MAGIKDGQVASADEVMNAYGLQFKNTMNSFFNSEYEGWNAKLGGDGEPVMKNLVYSTLQTDSAAMAYGWDYDSTDDMYKSTVPPYIRVEASSWSGTGATASIFIDGSASTGWLISINPTSTWTEEVKRAKLLEALFKGTGGTTDYAPVILEFTGVTALQTSITRDVGKRMSYVRFNGPTGASTTITKTGTPANTTDNDDSSFWSYCYSPTTTPGVYIRAYFPSSTQVNSADSSGPTTSNEIGTDTSADEVDNPSSLKLILTSNSAANGGISASLVLTKGSISWVSTGATPSLDTDVDFTADHSIPVFTALSSSDTSVLLFKNDSNATVTNTITTWNDEGDITSLYATNPCFEDVIGSTWVYSETDPTGVLSSGGRVTDMYGGETCGTHSYKIIKATGNTQQGTAEIVQTMDLSKVTEISVDYAFKSGQTGSVDTQANARIYIGEPPNQYELVSGPNAIMAWNSTSGDIAGTISGGVPAYLRKPGAKVVLKLVIYSSTTNSTAYELWFDNVILRGHGIASMVASISYDGGSNYETITDAIIQRNSNTGTDMWLKFSNTRTDLTAVDEFDK